MGLVGRVRARDHAASVRQLQPFESLPDGAPGSLVLELAGDPADIVERHEHEVAPGDAQVGGHEGALVADRIANDLDQDFPVALEDLFDFRVLGFGFGLVVVGVRNDVVGAKQAVPFNAESDEGGVERRLDGGDGAAVDVAAAQPGVGGGHLVGVEGVAVDDGNAHLVGALSVDEHSSGHGISATRWDLE